MEPPASILPADRVRPDAQLLIHSVTPPLQNPHLQTVSGKTLSYFYPANTVPMGDDVVVSTPQYKGFTSACVKFMSLGNETSQVSTGLHWGSLWFGKDCLHFIGSQVFIALALSPLPIMQALVSINNGTYVEIGVQTVGGDVAVDTKNCLASLLTSASGGLYCNAKVYNYICTATRVAEVVVEAL